MYTDFFNKEQFTEEDVYAIIKNEFQENIYLEFKSGQALNKQDKTKTEIAKDVSCFANSDGGIIIYGINEEDHKASNIVPVDSNLFSKEWLENIIQSNIHRSIKDLKIFPIYIDGDIGKTVFIVKVPISYDAPHMTSDHRYYRRLNFKVVELEEYEVRELYNRKAKAELEILEIEKIEGSQFGYNKIDRIDFYSKFYIQNVSNSIEHNYKIEFELPSHAIPAVHINTMQKDYKMFKNGYAIYSIANKSPLFQGEVFPTDFSFNFNINVLTQLESLELRIKLYYSNGVKNKDYKLLDLGVFQGERVDKNLFMPR